MGPHFVSPPQKSELLFNSARRNLDFKSWRRNSQTSEGNLTPEKVPQDG